MNDIILKEIGKIVIPYTQLFGIYVIFNGHLSPGGGFSGGTVIGASLILYKLIYDPKVIKKIVNYKVVMYSMSIALLGYGILKGYSFITGGAGLHLFQIPLGTPGNILSGGLLLPLNIAVGIIVGFTIFAFYSLFDEGEL